MDQDSNYYVYCYIDPRNFKVFYYGKGTGSRSHSHLMAQGRSAKQTTIDQIRRETGADPIIRVIAANLTEREAFLVEATLIWFGRTDGLLTNKITGHFSSHFRPQNSLHKALPGFDITQRIHFFNVGEPERSWDDCRMHGYLSAGYGPRFKRAAQKLHPGDLVMAYLSGHGYVGLGKVLAEAVPARDFRVRAKHLYQLGLNYQKMSHHSDDLESCEHVVSIRWIVAKDRTEALRKPGAFHARQTQAIMDKQIKTLRYIEQEWKVRFDQLLAESES